ncbi:MAG: aldose epimerase family protein [Bacteroidota bacterium]
MIHETKVSLIWITNKNGLRVAFTNFGQRLVSLFVPDKDGKLDDIVLGFDTIDKYVNSIDNYYGAIIGRYANRIADGTFSLNSKIYELEVNNGANHLHGGSRGFHNQVWNIDEITDSSICFSKVFGDMEEGYPGNLLVKTSYELTDDNELIINYVAETDKPTIVNLTHHSFFNLKGEGLGDINDHVLYINADNYVPVNKNSIPSGKILSVKNTPFDFTKEKTIGHDIFKENEQLRFGNGYDHTFVLKTPTSNDELAFAARVFEPVSERVLEVFTNEPGMQFYSGNFLDGSTIGKSGIRYQKNGAFCLETQHFPNSPNTVGFPTTKLNPGETYNSVCIYKFSING